jgi:hypothetical protein
VALDVLGEATRAIVDTDRPNSADNSRTSPASPSLPARGKTPVVTW